MLSTALLIDDDPVTSMLNKRVLERVNKDICVVIKNDVDEALDYLKENINPNLIFLDINMPGRDGLDFLCEFKKLELDSKVVILTSMSLRPNTLSQLNELSFSEIFIKPLSEDKLQRFL